MEIRTVNKSKLNPALYNPRKDLDPGDIEYEKLKKSILAFGEVDPIIWNEKTGNIVGGHQRFKVLRDMGQEDFDVSVVSLKPSEEGALNIALNKIAGEWDYPKLKDLISEIDTGEFDIEVTGFDADELTELFGLSVDIIEPPDFQNIDHDFQQITFILHNSQVDIVKVALGLEKKNSDYNNDVNKNSNGNAIFAICEGYVNGKSKTNQA